MLLSTQIDSVDTVDSVDTIDTVDILDILDTVDILDILDTVDSVDTLDLYTVDTHYVAVAEGAAALIAAETPGSQLGHILDSAARPLSL